MILLEIFRNDSYSISNKEKASFIVTEHIISLQSVLLCQDEPSQHILSIIMIMILQAYDKVCYNVCSDTPVK